MVPDLTHAVGAPRVAGIEFPFGRPLGQPHDAPAQRVVLWAALRVLQDADRPGTVIDLPFQWPEPAERVHWHPAEPPPIGRLLSREPKRFTQLVDGELPPAASRRDP
jgi:hypothetical protein